MLTGPIPALVDHRKMSAQARELSGSVPLAEFHRLCELLEDNSGDVHLKIAFSRGDLDRTHIAGHVAANVCMVCQNCLQAYDQPLDSWLSVTVVAGVDALDSLEEEEDGYVCGDVELSILDLLEDELLLSVPMIPRHPGECPGERPGEQKKVTTGQGQDVETHRPFADLAGAIRMNTQQNKETES